MTLRLEIDGPVARLLLDRPDKRNAITQGMWDAFPGMIAEAVASPTRLILLASATPGMFCAGADIGEFGAGARDPDWLKTNQAAINRTQHDLTRAAKPVIAFVDGDCVGGGCGLALACDLRVATSRARFGITPAKLGLVYPLHDTKLLVDLVGPAHAKRLLYTGMLIDAAEALRIGLIDMIADTPDVLIAQIIAQSGHSQRQTKAMIRRVLDGQSEDDDATRMIFAEAFAGPDFAEGVDAFLSKRKADFPMNHGQIIGALATVPDLDAALADYGGALGLQVAERGTIDEALAKSWAAPGVAGSRYAALCSASGAPSTIRLVEQPAMPGYRPTTTFGWNAFEISVQDVYGWPAKLGGTAFDIVGPPREIPGLPYFVAMQMVGRGGEMVYLNEVRQNTPTSDLPKAASPVDMVFIVILATPDRAGTVAWYRDRLKLDEGGSYTIEYTMINKAFGLPDGTQSTITMVQQGRMPIAEIDGYPPAAVARPVADGMLPPGNALVTLAVDSVDALELDWLTPPVSRDGLPYRGRRAATLRGPAGELLELVEISPAP